MTKTLTVDLHSLDECNRAFNIIKSRLAELKRVDTNGIYISKAAHTKIVFDECSNIINTDISKLYANLELDESPVYYVYAHCDPTKKIALKKEGRSTFAATLGMSNRPFYIGKGAGNRAYDLNRNESHRKVRQKIKTFNQDIDVKILRHSLSEKAALMLEAKLIDIFGTLAQGGSLVNLDEGVASQERKSMYINSLKELSIFYRNSV